MTTIERTAMILCLLLLGMLLLYMHDAAVRTQAQAAVRQDSLQAVMDSIDHQDARRRADSMRIADSLTVLERTVQVGGHRVDTLRLRADSFVRMDSLRPALALKDSVIAEQATEITALRAQVLLLGAARLSTDSSRSAWETAAKNAREQLTAALRRTKPRWGCTVGPTAALGLAGNAAVGLGATCGLLF